MPDIVQPTGQTNPSEGQPAVQPVPQPVAQAAPEPVVQSTAQPTVQPVAQPEADRTTDQFNKLIDSNRRLFEANELLRQELQKRTTTGQTFAPIQQTQPTQVNPEDFIETDENGDQFINQERLKNRLQEVQERASRAETAVQNYIQNSEQREIQRQNEEAFTAYPALNPKSETFDLEMHKQTRALIYDSLINPQDYNGRSLTFREAADRVKGPGGIIENKSASGETGGEPVTQPSEEGQTLKEQGSLAASGQPQQAVAQAADEADRQGLVAATRQGDTWALAQRLVNTDHVKPPEEEPTT